MAKYAKAVVGALVAGLTALGTALTPDAGTQAVQVTPAEWVVVTVATLVALGAVWRVPNGTEGDHQS